MAIQLNQDVVEVVNRTSKSLGVRYDGQDMTLKPNYDKDGKFLKGVHNFVPRIVIPYARNQNIIMGSEDAIDPSDYQSLIGVVAADNAKQKDDLTFVASNDAAPTRVRLEDLIGDNDRVKQGRGVFKASEAMVPQVQGGIHDAPGSDA